jgi:hypothetical protein
VAMGGGGGVGVWAAVWCSRGKVAWCGVVCGAVEWSRDWGEMGETGETGVRGEMG